MIIDNQEDRFPRAVACIETSMDYWSSMLMNPSHKLWSSALLASALVVGTAVFPLHLSIVAAQTAQVQSISGRITSVEGNTFTLDSSKRDKTTTSRSVTQNGKVLALTLDQDTDVYGKIAVGVNANVTYRQEDGNNIAISVRIVQQSP